MTPPRKMMTMRAYVQKDDNLGSLDDFNNPLAPSWVAKKTIACKAWSSNERTVTSENRVAVIEAVRCSVPLDAAIDKTDRIEKITDRRTGSTARTYFAGPLGIEGIEKRTTHQELTLQEIS